MHNRSLRLVCWACLVASAVAVPALSSAANLIVNNGFENNPPAQTIGNHIPWSITPWTLGPGALANVVAVNGGTGYGNGGPNLDAEGHPVGTFQHYLDINGGDNTVSQSFTVPTCGASDASPRTVDFSGYFSIRDSTAATGSGYIRILDQTALVNGAPTVLKQVSITNLRSTDDAGNIVAPINQTWKNFGDSVEVIPGHRITYEAYISDFLNFDNAYMAFRDFDCHSTTLAMAKQWNGGVSGHRATLQATRDNGTTPVDSLVATADGSAGQVIQDSSAFTVFAGDKIRISEMLSNTGTTIYSQSMSCTGDTNVSNLSSGVFDVEVGSVNVNTAPIVCTMVNTNITQSTLKLNKQWFGAQEGDIATLNATALQPSGTAPITFTSTATSLANAAAGQLQSGLATVVPNGASFTVSEVLSNSATTAGTYDSKLTCTNAVLAGQIVTLNPGAGTQAECTITNVVAGLSIEKQASTPADTNGSGVAGDVGDQITYTFTVQNTGRAELADVQINDGMLLASNAPIVWTSGSAPTSLAVNEIATATAVYTITESDVENPSGFVVNTATASARTISSNQAVSSLEGTTSTPVVASHPSLSIFKSASTADTNNSGLIGDIGDTITYQFIITNTGDTRLTGIQIQDPLPGLSTPDFSSWPGQSGTLEVNEFVTASATYTIQSADVVATKIDNQATATANQLAGVSPTAQSQLVSTPTFAPQPKLSITKVASVADTNISSVTGDAGDVITYTITVINEGDAQLTGVSIIDSMVGLSALNIQWPNQALPGTLVKGAAAVATATYTVQAGDVSKGEVVNTATVRSSAVAGVKIDDISATATTLTNRPKSIPVPTLNDWGIALMTLLLGVFGFFWMRRNHLQ
ncbi:hypothetical protein GCM10027276_33040 [Comamonas piscis]